MYSPIYTMPPKGSGKGKEAAEAASTLGKTERAPGQASLFEAFAKSPKKARRAPADAPLEKAWPYINTGSFLSSGSIF